MTDIEINKALALAIGWQEGDLQVWTPEHSLHRVYIKTLYGWPCSDLTEFDYRDPAVIWPIAERYSLFPSGVSKGDYAAAEKLGRPINDGWECLRWHYDKIDGKARGWVRYTADTAAKAVAIAVIGLMA